MTMKTKYKTLAILAGLAVMFIMFTDCSKKQTKVDVLPEIIEPASVEEIEIVEPVEKVIENKVIENELSPVYFEFDKSYLNLDALKELNNVYVVMSIDESLTLHIDGHTCEEGTFEYNMGLGDARAFSCRKYLKDRDIDPERITTVSWGEEKPVSEILSMNRRCEFTIK